MHDALRSQIQNQANPATSSDRVFLRDDGSLAPPATKLRFFARGADEEARPYGKESSHVRTPRPAPSKAARCDMEVALAGTARQHAGFKGSMIVLGVVAVYIAIRVFIIS